MTPEKRRIKALDAAINGQDALKALETATCLLSAVETEIDRLVDIEPSHPRLICERAGFLLGLFQQQELTPALAEIERAFVQVRELLGYPMTATDEP